MSYIYRKRSLFASLFPPSESYIAAKHGSYNNEKVIELKSQKRFDECKFNAFSVRYFESLCFIGWGRLWEAGIQVKVRIIFVVENKNQWYLQDSNSKQCDRQHKEHQERLLGQLGVPLGKNSTFLKWCSPYTAGLMQYLDDISKLENWCFITPTLSVTAIRGFRQLSVLQAVLNKFTRRVTPYDLSVCLGYHKIQNSTDNNSINQASNTVQLRIDLFFNSDERLQRK